VADREKVLAGLRACRIWGQWDERCQEVGCPYWAAVQGDDDNSFLCITILHDDAEELIESMEKEEDDGK